VIALAAIGYQPPQESSVSANIADRAMNADGRSATYSVSVDDLVATSVAANIAQTTNLPVASNVANLSQSIAAESVLAQNDANIVAKPQVVQANADTRDIRTYTAKTGDNVGTIADRFGISKDTVRWVNDLSSDAVEPGRKLRILPTNGVLYTSKDGDTVEKIAQTYSSSAQQIKLYNDLDLGGLKPGRELIIPSGALPETERPGYVAPQPAPSTSIARNGIVGGNYSGGYGSANNLGATAGNRYAFGNCTWYAYERRLQLGRPVGSFWGNASTWAAYAAAAGYVVNNNPTVGSLMANGGGYGHVSVVESVNPGVSITISEMNAYRFGGGFNRIGNGTIPWNEAVSGMYRYIQ
jgi:surface antigen